MLQPLRLTNVAGVWATNNSPVYHNHRSSYAAQPRWFLPIVMIFSQSLTKPCSFSQHHRRCFPVPMPQPMVVTTVWHSPDISSLVESIYLGPSSVQSDSCGRFGGNSSVIGSSIIGCFACGVVSFCTFLLLCKDGLLLSTAQQPVNMVLFAESNPLNREMTISFVTRLR